MTTDSKPQVGEFCWNELMTGDTKKAQEFYSGLFGWTTQTHDMGDMTYTMFMNGDKGLGGMMQIPDDKAAHIPPHWMSYICVENLEETLKNAQTLGATVLIPIKAAGDMGRLAIVQDPTGAAIAFWEPSK